MLRRLFGHLCIAAALWLAAATRAGAEPPPAPAMTFDLMRGGGLECEPDCPEWIAAQGAIAPGTARLFKTFLATLDGRRRPIVINSNGGSVDDALEMGRLIRAQRLAVAVGRTNVFAPPPAFNLIKPLPQTPKAGYVYSYPALCLSACTFILAGGVERYASPLAIVGVHEVKRRQTKTFVLRRFLIHYRVLNGQKQEISRKVVSEDKNTVTSTDIAPAEVNARVAAFFREMGEDSKLMQLMGSASPDEIHRMTADEEKDTRLVTIWIDQSAAMVAKPYESGLAGVPADASSGARATLEAEQTWTLEPSDTSENREFTLHLLARRGAGGVSATFALLDSSPTPTRYGVAPGALGVRRAPSTDRRTQTVFLPDAVFCRYASVGDLFVIRATPSPTHAPGTPDPRAPLLRIPFANVNGASTLVGEFCGADKVASRK